MKLSFKIITLFTGIVSCILLGMSLLVFNLSRENVRKDFRQRIRTRAARAAYLYGIFRNDTTNLLKSLDANTPPVLLNKNIVVYDSNFVELYEFHDSTVVEIKPDSSWLINAKENGEYFLQMDRKDIGTFSFSDGITVMVAG